MGPCKLDPLRQEPSAMTSGTASHAQWLRCTGVQAIEVSPRPSHLSLISPCEGGRIGAVGFPRYSALFLILYFGNLKRLAILELPVVAGFPGRPISCKTICRFGHERSTILGGFVPIAVGISHVQNRPNVVSSPQGRPV